MKDSHQSLPPGVNTPLWGASFAIGCFLVAFCLWAAFVPLATTISLQGNIKSQTPAFALQHPYGGAVSEVLVAPHQRVQANQTLLRLESDILQDSLNAQKSIRDRLLQDNRDIERVMQSFNNPFSEDIAEASPHFLRHNHVLAKAQTSTQTAKNLKEQTKALSAKIGHAQRQLELMENRQKRYATLASKALLESERTEQLQEQILILRGEIEADRASVLSLESQGQQTLKQQDLAQIAWRHELIVNRQANLRQLDEVHHSILTLQDQLEKTAIKSPIDGVVTAIPAQSEGMFAARGATVLTLAQPLDNAQVSFTIPVHQIDQIQPGMSARMVIPGLPQRLMPKIDLLIKAISPRADTDDQGNPTGFRGLAIADTDGADVFDVIKDIGPISEDMPVVLTVSVRQTTLAQYLLEPLLASFAKSLQD